MHGSVIRRRHGHQRGGLRVDRFRPGHHRPHHHPGLLLHDLHRPDTQQSVSFTGTASGTSRTGTLSLMVVLSWLNFHPGDSPEDIARMFGAYVDEIAKCCADLLAAGFIEPTTWH